MAIVKTFKLRNSNVKMFFVDKPKKSHRVDYSAMTKSHQAKKSR